VGENTRSLEDTDTIMTNMEPTLRRSRTGSPFVRTVWSSSTNEQARTPRPARCKTIHENEAYYDSDGGAAVADVDDDALKSNQAPEKLLRMNRCSGAGSQGHYTLQRGNSCPDVTSSSASAAAAESQASSLPAIKIDQGFFKSYAQHIKTQRAMLSSAQTS
jgi:hypothetical protein